MAFYLKNVQSFEDFCRLNRPSYFWTIPKQIQARLTVRKDSFQPYNQTIEPNSQCSLQVNDRFFMKSSLTTVFKSQIALSSIITLLIFGFIQFGKFLSVLPDEKANLYLTSALIICFLILNGYFYLRRAGRSLLRPPTDLDLEDDDFSQTDKLEQTADTTITKDSVAVVEDEIPAADQSYSLLEQIPQGIIIADANGEIRYVNTTAKGILIKISQFLPIDIDKMLGTSYFALCQDAEEIKTVFRNGEPLPYQADLTVGSEIIETLSLPLTDNHGNYIGPMIAWKVVTYGRNQDRWNQVVEEQIQNASLDLTATSKELQNIYQQMKNLAEQTVSQAQDVSDFADQTSEQINQIAAAIQQTSRTIRTIAEMVDEGSSISKNALTEAQNASQIITELSDTSTEIRKMVQMIEHIMEQTRMLALNATIEAIGAGSAGVGFKVIADEVRDISRETTKMAGDIIQMIELMMNKIPLSVQSMKTVQKVINQMNEITLSISEEMQKETTNVDAVKNNMNEADQKSQQIVERMKAIESQSQDTKEQVNKGFETTNEIEHIDETFRIISKRFGEERIVTPNDIYRQNQIINHLLDALMQKLNPPGYDMAQALGLLEFNDKKPFDVLKKSISTAKIFLKRMDLPEERIDFPKGQVTPTQTYNFLMQFMQVLEKSLIEIGIPDVENIKRAEPVDGKSPNDAFSVIELANRKLQHL